MPNKCYGLATTLFSLLCYKIDTMFVDSFLKLLPTFLLSSIYLIFNIVINIVNTCHE